MFCSSMAYVAISRLKTFASLGIIALDPSSQGFKVSAKALGEMTHLRQIDKHRHLSIIVPIHFGIYIMLSLHLLSGATWILPMSAIFI